jgi:hypothetical protein
MTRVSSLRFTRTPERSADHGRQWPRLMPTQRHYRKAAGPAVKSGHQLWTIGYFSKIASICLYALSAAASGVIPPRMMSAQAALQTWVF